MLCSRHNAGDRSITVGHEIILCNLCFGCIRLGTLGSSWLERQFFSCQRSNEKETARELHQLFGVVCILFYLFQLNEALENVCFNCLVVLRVVFNLV